MKTEIKPWDIEVHFTDEFECVVFRRARILEDGSFVRIEFDFDESTQNPKIIWYPTARIYAVKEATE